MAIAEGQRVRGMVRGVSRGLSVAVVLGSLAAFGWVAFGAVKAADTLTKAQWAPFIGAIVLQFIMLLWERLLTILQGNRKRTD